MTKVTCVNFVRHFGMGSNGEESTLSLSHIEKFNGENFCLRKFKMQMVLEDKDLWGIASSNEVELGEEGTTETQRWQFQRHA